jgi:hypothetical protein
VAMAGLLARLNDCDHVLLVVRFCDFFPRGK